MRGYASLIDEMARNIVDFIATKDDKAIRGMLRGARRMTTTNCWFVTYRLRELTIELCLDELKNRRQQRRREKNSGKSK